MPKVELTQSFIHNARVDLKTRSLDCYDKKIRGLLLKVSASGRKTFYIRFKDSAGLNRQRKIGNAAILTLDEARALARGLPCADKSRPRPFPPCAYKLGAYTRGFRPKRVSTLCNDLQKVLEYG